MFDTNNHSIYGTCHNSTSGVPYSQHPSPQRLLLLSLLHWIHLHSHFLGSGTFCLIIQLIGPHQRKRAQRVEKNHIGKHAHCHSYNNKQFGRNLDVQHWWSGAEICGDIHFVEYCAVNKIENYAVCLGT